MPCKNKIKMLNNNSEHDGLRFIILYDTTEEIILSWYSENGNKLQNWKRNYSFSIKISVNWFYIEEDCS